jgi:hypothetical protein
MYSLPCPVQLSAKFVLGAIVYMQRKNTLEEAVCVLDFDFTFFQQFYDVTQN